MRRLVQRLQGLRHGKNGQAWQRLLVFSG
jgi:hypothetical protein